MTPSQVAALRPFTPWWQKGGKAKGPPPQMIKGWGGTKGNKGGFGGGFGKKGKFGKGKGKGKSAFMTLLRQMSQGGWSWLTGMTATLPSLSEVFAPWQPERW